MLGIVDAGSWFAVQHPEWLAGNHFTMTGTSQSAAVASGVATLVLSADPSLTPDEVKCRLMASARSAVDGSNGLAAWISQAKPGP